MNTTTATRDTFNTRIRDAEGAPLRGMTIDTVQANIGLKCNLACRHCHVESSPKRDEEMAWQTMCDVLRAADRAGAATLDITGGAPEMHPHFCAFVDAAIAQGLHVIVRTNLTIMLCDGYTDMPRWFADRGVHLIASLPCYLEENVDRQRGRYVYRESVDVIRKLNDVGYGDSDETPLDLIYNPLGPSLPPSQADLEDAYRRELDAQFGIQFRHLYTITNMAIGRFLDDLRRDGKDDAYQQTLRNAFNPATLEGLMCRHQLHVGWDGRLYDCDFNFALDLPVVGDVRHVRDFDPAAFHRRAIATDEHCFACTAGSGSSCCGTLT